MSKVAALVVVAMTVTLSPVVLAHGNSAATAAIAGAATGGGAARTSVTKAARYVADMGNVQRELNRCRGPVAWNSRGEGAHWLLFEHDFCGGAWAISARAGDRLQIRNGVLDGTWRANGKVRVVTQGAMVSTTRGLGYLVAQTCIPGTSKIRLVGFDRVR